MRFKKTLALPLVLPILLSLLLVGSLAGCGGGSDQSGGQEQEQGEKAAGEAARKEPLQRKVAIGTVRAFKDDKSRLSLRPAANAQSKKPLGFKVRKSAEITLGGEKAEPGDIKEGQQAQVTYVVKNEVNRAVVVHLFEPNEQPSGEDEKKGQPSEGGEESG